MKVKIKITGYIPFRENRTERTISLLPKHVGIGSTIEAQYNELRNTATYKTIDSDGCDRDWVFTPDVNCEIVS